MRSNFHKNATELWAHERILDLFINTDGLTLTQIVGYLGCKARTTRNVFHSLVKDKILEKINDDRPEKFKMNQELKVVFLTRRQKQLETYEEVLGYYKKELKSK